MSFTQKYFPPGQDLHRERQTRKWEHLRVVRNFQLQCMNRAQAPDIREKYREIVKLLEQAICEYEERLGKLESESKK